MGARRRLFPSVRISVRAVAFAHHVSERAERIVHNASQACDEQPDRKNVFYHEASGDRELRHTLRAEAAACRRSRPRRTLHSHDCQRASRKLSVHAVDLCALCPHCTVQALRARGKRAVALPHAFGLPAIVAGWNWCTTSTTSAAAVSTATTTMHSPAHRRLRQPLRMQRCTTRPLFTRPAWPRRALRSHDCRCAPRMPSFRIVAMCSPCAHHAPHYTAQALNAGSAAYATLARSSTRLT